MCIYILIHENFSIINVFTILDIDPCGENSPFIIQTNTDGFIDSSLLAVDNYKQLNCKWLLKLKREKSFTVVAHDVQLDDR